MKFADIDLSMSTEVWDCNIYIAGANKQVIIIDCATKVSGISNSFYIKDLGVLESLLRCYFGFADDDVDYIIESCTL